MRHRSFIRVAFSGAALASLLLAVPARSADIEAWIDTQEQGGMLEVTPKVRVQNPRAIRYELSAQRTGSAGTSSSRQAGARAVTCCEPVSLAALRLSFAPSDAYELVLRIYVNNELAAEAEVSYPPASQ